MEKKESESLSPKDDKDTDGGLTDLMRASAEGKLDGMRTLLAQKADVNAINNAGATALMFAAKNNQIEAVKILLAASADVNIFTHKNNTALSLARQFGHKEVEQLLLPLASSLPKWAEKFMTWYGSIAYIAIVKLFQITAGGLTIILECAVGLLIAKLWISKVNARREKLNTGDAILAFVVMHAAASVAIDLLMSGILFVVTNH